MQAMEQSPQRSQSFLLFSERSVDSLNIIKVILFPVRIQNNIIYGRSPSAVVGYAWYSREEYKKVIEASKDELGILVATYDKWKNTADRNVKKMKDKGWIVIKVKVKSDDLQKWLNKLLVNISENREKYVDYRLNEFFDDAHI